MKFCIIDQNPGQTGVRTTFNALLLKGALAAIPIALAAVASPASSLTLEGTNPYLQGPFKINTTRPTPTLIDSGLSNLNVAGSAFDMQVTNLSGLTPSQQAIFATAAATWESYIPSYKPNINIGALVIDASGIAIDGPGGTLGQAGPTMATSQGGFTLPTKGIMEFDTADLASLEGAGLLDEVILHEMAHVMGFGTLWNFGLNNVYVDGTGRYTGAFGLAAWRTEFTGPGAGPGAAFVPVELGGGSGTADGHWDEVDGGAGPTGRVQIGTGRDMEFELMTGWLNAPPSFISNTTVQSFMDIGYQTVPEPLTILGAGTAVGFGAFFKRRLAKAQKKDEQEN